MELYVDGLAADAGAPAQIDRVEPDPMSVDLRIASQAGSNALEVEFDNVVVTFRK